MRWPCQGGGTSRHTSKPGDLVAGALRRHLGDVALLVVQLADPRAV
ncbi:hypothetical protein [Streptomyces sp. SAS_270]